MMFEVQKVIKEVEDKLGDRKDVFLFVNQELNRLYVLWLEADTNEKCLQSVDYIISKMKNADLLLKR